MVVWGTDKMSVFFEKLSCCCCFWCGRWNPERFHHANILTANYALKCTNKSRSRGLISEISQQWYRWERWLKEKIANKWKISSLTGVSVKGYAFSLESVLQKSNFSWWVAVVKFQGQKSVTKFQFSSLKLMR